MGFSDSKHWLLLWRAWLPAPTGTPDVTHSPDPQRGLFLKCRPRHLNPHHHHFQLSLKSQQNRGCIG